MQIDLFDRADGVQWRQLPAEAREHVLELLARVVLECLRQRALEGEADDDR